MRQRSRYDAIPSLLSRFDKAVRGTVLSEMSYCGDPSIEAVRCVGNHNSERTPAFPRMHHKFIVLCNEIGNEDDWKNYEPYEVWTGSFNFTKNAGFSLENAIVVNDTEIAKAYFNEWAQIAALSEKLDWRSDWVEPQWRVGS